MVHLHATQGNPDSIPARAGIGLRAPHYQDILTLLPGIGWIEVHSENYFGPGGAPLFYLQQVRKHYPLSLHGVGLSLGSTDALNIRHLEKLKGLINRFEPGLVSDHPCWSSVGGRYLNDLLPLPYTEEALAHVCNRIVQVQEYLGRPILIENLSSYLEYSHTTIAEWEFISELARRADCGILLDVNNVYVSACNHGFDAQYYLGSVPVRENGLNARRRLCIYRNNTFASLTEALQACYPVVERLVGAGSLPMRPTVTSVRIPPPQGICKSSAVSFRSSSRIFPLYPIFGGEI